MVGDSDDGYAKTSRRTSQIFDSLAIRPSHHCDIIFILNICSTYLPKGSFTRHLLCKKEFSHNLRRLKRPPSTQ